MDVETRRHEMEESETTTAQNRSASYHFSETSAECPPIAHRYVSTVNDEDSNDESTISSLKDSSDFPLTEHHIVVADGAARNTTSSENASAATFFSKPLHGGDSCEVEAKAEEKGEIKGKASKVVRKYCCEICGLSRSKKSLITSHMISTHKKKAPPETTAPEPRLPKPYTCEDCGVSFRKPAYLKQHMQGHSLDISDGICGSIGSRKENSEMLEAERSHGFGGLVAGRGTSCKDPSAAPRSRVLSLLYMRSALSASPTPPPLSDARHPLTGLRPYAFFLQRRFRCPEEKCSSSYRRKDHLTRHMRTHSDVNGFECTLPGCGKKFLYKCNMARHVEKVHEKKKRRRRVVAASAPEELTCGEPGCGKVFKYPSRLRHHTDVSHWKVKSEGVLCSEPGCLRFFGDTARLRAHCRASHRRIKCRICGAKLLRASIWCHSRLHRSSPRVDCRVEGCTRTFSNRANMLLHVRAAHERLRPFFCRRPNCRQRFAFRHVRDRHERCGIHSHTQKKRDLAKVEGSKERKGGEGKRKRARIDMLVEKLATAPVAREALNYLSWLLFQD